MVIKYNGGRWSGFKRGNFTRWWPLRKYALSAGISHLPPAFVQLSLNPSLCSLSLLHLSFFPASKPQFDAVFSYNLKKKRENGKHEAGWGLPPHCAPWLMISLHKDSDNADRIPAMVTISSWHTPETSTAAASGLNRCSIVLRVVMVFDGGRSSQQWFTSRVMNRLCTRYQWWMNNALCPSFDLAGCFWKTKEHTPAQFTGWI